MSKILQDEMKIAKILKPYSLKCKNCGHTIVLVRQDKKICDWCGHYVFKDKKAEFKYRLKEQLLRK